MELTIRLAQGRWQEAWWVLASHGGALGCLLASQIGAWSASAIAVVVCLDGWRTARRYGLRAHPLSVVGVHIKDSRIAGLNLNNGRYLQATAYGPIVRLGLLDVITVRAPEAAARAWVIVDAHRCIKTWERHLLRFAARQIGAT